MKDIMGSFRSVLYERVTSPFFGTFICAWLITNWKILYATFFVSEESLGCNRIDYIISNCIDIYTLLLIPLVSTIILIAGIPFISNGAYWLNLWFRQWRIKQRSKFEKEQPILPDKAIKLRSDMEEFQSKLEKTISGKDDEIKLLNEKNKMAQSIINDLNKEIDNLKINEGIINHKIISLQDDLEKYVYENTNINAKIKEITSIRNMIESPNIKAVDIFGNVSWGKDVVNYSNNSIITFNLKLVDGSFLHSISKNHSTLKFIILSTFIKEDINSVYIVLKDVDKNEVVVEFVSILNDTIKGISLIDNNKVSYTKIM